MAEKLKVRNVAPFLQALRNFLLGRKHVPERSALRYTALVAARTQPPPVIPEGEAHRLSANAYCHRDGRREALPPILVVDPSSAAKQISAGDAAAKKSSGPVTPGKYFELSQRFDFKNKK